MESQCHLNIAPFIPYYLVFLVITDLEFSEAEVFNFIYPDKGAGVERLLFIT